MLYCELGGAMKVFEELTADSCRWLLAKFDRCEFLFCSEPVTERHIARRMRCSYCADHAALAYKLSRPTGRTIAKLEAAEDDGRSSSRSPLLLEAGFYQGFGDPFNKY